MCLISPLLQVHLNAVQFDKELRVPEMIMLNDKTQW